MEIIRSTALMFLVIVFLDTATSRPIPRTSGPEVRVRTIIIPTIPTINGDTATYREHLLPTTPTMYTEGETSTAEENLLPTTMNIYPEDRKLKVPTANPIELSREMLDLLEQHPNWLPEKPIKSRRNRMTIRKPFREELSAAPPDDPEERYPWMRRARSRKLEEELKKIEKQEAYPEME